MKLFDVYALFPIEPVKASGSWLWDKQGRKYLDLYGGHAVISIGHAHPTYVSRIKNQLDAIGFYSNSVENSLQIKLAELLGEISGYSSYQLFLCNSGAEANENALKLASFVTGRKKIIAFSKGFHGRTSGAVAITDNSKIQAPFNLGHEVKILPFNDVESLKNIDSDTAAVIVEPIQGVGGIIEATTEFLQKIQSQCKKTNALFIADEVQCGYGRTGKFFAHQHANVQPDIITTAKGMGNGFPIGGVLIHPDIKPSMGMLGTTFGGNHLSCAAALAVLDVIQQEDLIKNSYEMGIIIQNKLKTFSGLGNIRGKGLMIGFDAPENQLSLRKDLLEKHYIFTGYSAPNSVRLLPSLGVNKEEAAVFFNAMETELTK